MNVNLLSFNVFLHLMQLLSLCDHFQFVLFYGLVKLALLLVQ